MGGGIGRAAVLGGAVLGRVELRGTTVLDNRRVPTISSIITLYEITACTSNQLPKVFKNLQTAQDLYTSRDLCNICENESD